MNFELTFEQLQKKLKKVLNPSRFRFVVILYPNTNMIDEIKDYIKEVYPKSLVTSLDLKDRSYQDVASELYKNNEGFVYINDFEEILNKPDLYNGFNQRRDKIASFNINLICFISLYKKDELFTKAINVIPDLWEFKNTVLELEKDIQTDKLSDIKVSESSSYSSIGGLTTKDKKIELEKLLKKSEESNSDELKLNLLYQIATIYKDIGDLPNSLRYFKDKLILSKNLNISKVKLAIIYNDISTIYHEIGNLEEALICQTKSLESFQNKNEYLRVGYSNLSTIYRDMGKLDTALNYQKKSLELYKENDIGLGTGYNIMSLIYQDKGDLTKSLLYQKKSLDINEIHLEKNNPVLANNYNNLSLIYKDMGELYKAIEYQYMAIKINEEILGNNHPYLAVSYNNIGGIYIDLKECKKAKEYLEKSLIILEKLDYTHPKHLQTKQNLKHLNSQIKKQQKAGYKQKGKYCKDI